MPPHPPRALRARALTATSSPPAGRPSVDRMTSPSVPSTGPGERRRVASDDPSLSPEANQMLTEELRAIVGSAFVEVPTERADPAHARHGTHREGSPS